MTDDDATVPQPLDMHPWHEPARLRMQAAAVSARLPHAVLVHGPAGVGKGRFEIGRAHV